MSTEECTVAISRTMADKNENEMIQMKPADDATQL